MFKALIDAGADSTVVNGSGDDAITYARKVRIYSETDKQHASRVDELCSYIALREAAQITASLGADAGTFGYAVDLTIARVFAPQLARAHKVCTDEASIGPDELNMGTSYDCFDLKSETLKPGISSEAQKNRKFFVDVMAKEGFSNFAKEWWHFNFKRPL